MQHPAEFSLVGKSDLGTTVKAKGEMLKSNRGFGGSLDQQLPGHPKVNDDGGVIAQADDQVFPAATDADDRPADRSRRKHRRWHIPDNTGEGPYSDLLDDVTEDCRSKGRADRLDFREFWHTRVLMSRHGGLEL